MIDYQMTFQLAVFFANLIAENAKERVLHLSAILFKDIVVIKIFI
jgi:hypothetical protein